MLVLLFRAGGCQFPHQIKYKHHGKNRSVYIEVIVLEIFSASQQPGLLLALGVFSRHAVFLNIYITVNRILTPQLHTVNALLKC